MKITLILSLAVVSLVAFSCGRVDNSDARFQKLANNFIEQLLQNNPEWATWLGDHRYDSHLNSYDLEHLASWLNINRAYLDSLVTIDAAKLNDTNRIDYEILENNLKYTLFRIDTLRGYLWQTTRYNPGGAIYGLLVRDFAPIDQRLVSVKGRLEEIPRLLIEARTNLDNPPKIYTETAIGQITGTLNMIDKGMDQFIGDASDSVKESLKPAREAAVKALNEYLTWLKEDLLPRSKGDFRIGKDKYNRKLYYVLESDFDAPQILARAEAELDTTTDELYRTALPLFEKYYPKEATEKNIKEKSYVIRKVLDHMAEDHPTAKNIVDKAKSDLVECTAFVKEHNIVSVPEKPIDVIVMPEFERGVAVAYCSSPGPLEANGETFYAIAPPPSDWNKEQVNSYFREYNNEMLYDLTMHEAMPGHYLQAAHSNQFKAPTMVRAIFGSGVFAEGWATYGEQVMVNQGFGGAELKAQMLKMRLRMIINAIIDQKIHTEGMTEDEAMDMMLNRGFQEQGEAAGKWRRACLSSTQLSTYYVGNIEMNDLRRDAQNKLGDQFDLKTYHDQLLSYGTPPPKYVRWMMGL